mgnify:CR=1 FL=1
MKISSTTFEKSKFLATQLQSQIDHSTKHTKNKFHETMKQMLKDPINKVFFI